MSHRVCLFLITPLIWLCGVSVQASTSLDFSPIQKELRVDGASRKIVFFRSAHIGMGRLSLVEYSPPWPITGTHDNAMMRVPNRDASVYLKSIETTEPLDLEDEAAVVEWVKKAIPTGATRVQVEQVCKDPVRLNGNPTIEVTASFALYGRALQISVYLCHRRGNRPLELFLFQVAASPTHFKEAHDAFQSSLYSIVGF